MERERKSFQNILVGIYETLVTEYFETIFLWYKSWSWLVLVSDSQWVG